MKKLFTTLILLLVIPLAAVSANYEDDVWSYLFYLEYKQGIIAVQSGAKYPYDPIPDLFVSKYDPSTSDFYGIITSGKGAELARFGFNTPNTTLVAQGKSIMEVRAPYYANADHVTFYNKAGKRFFNISVKGSSFCNDNNICDARVGENYVNCPNDCEAPEVLPTPTPSPTINPPINIDPAPQPPNPSVVVGVETPELMGGEITKTESTLPISFSPKMIILLVVSALLLIFGIILLRMRKHMD